MPLPRLLLVAAGLLATSMIAFAATGVNGDAMIARIEAEAAQARDAAGGRGIAISARTPQGWPTRHLELSGGNFLDPVIRARAAAAIADVPGVGGVRWKTGPRRQVSRDAAASTATAPLHCQQDVDATLKARPIRFSEASAAIDPASQRLLDEVASAIRPCLGGIVAVTGHTDAAGDEAGNIALSKARAEAVRWALVARGISPHGIRTAGAGSHSPIPGLDPADPANRRIEFSVLEPVRLKPTPVDTPGPG